MIKENKAFTEILNKFYENGLLKEVYLSKKAIVCNAFDQFYIAFDVDMTKEFDLRDGFPGIKMATSGLKCVIENDGYILQYFTALSTESKKKALLILDDKLFQHFLANKSEFSKRQPNPAMDLKFEQEVMEKGKDALKQKENAPEHKLFGFWNRK